MVAISVTESCRYIRNKWGGTARRAVPGDKTLKRRTLIGTVGASIGLGTIGIVSANHQENYAEIEFGDQKSDGTVVTVE